MQTRQLGSTDLHIRPLGFLSAADCRLDAGDLREMEQALADAAGPVSH